MRKGEINNLMRRYVRENLSPSENERQFVSLIYASVQDVLGEKSCLQIGSFPRYTAITPLHDLDILNILGEWESDTDPSEVLEQLHRTLNTEYQNPTKYTVEITRQTHSITIAFLKENETVFSVDIVPAYILDKNEFGDDLYCVPEIATKSHNDRLRVQERVSRGAQEMQWIKSDPRGYISVATRVNAENEDFRKAVKFVKAWRAHWKEKDDNFPLKSFHLEQVITGDFQRRPEIEIFDAVFDFFYNLPAIIQRAQIPDRADPDRMIDEYINNLTIGEKERIKEARDHFLIQLEEVQSYEDVAALVLPDTHRRACAAEAYLFDQGIPILTEVQFSITGKALRRDGFREKILNVLGIIEIDRRVEFRLGQNVPDADLFKWKVKNDDNSPEPRGEITNNRTLRDPEHTKFNGAHYVECFAIRNGVCIGRTRQDVKLNSRYNT